MEHSNHSLQAMFVYSNPGSHPFISEGEKTYLKREIGQLERDKSMKNVPTPWAIIFTSAPVLSMLLAQVGFGHEHK